MRIQLALALMAAEVFAAGPEIVDVRRIWDAAPHNAFTDLVRHKGTFYCAFREGSAHVSPDGRVRVLVSSDGREWTSAALLESATGDLRDPKLAITPDGRLMLSGASALHQPAPAHHQVYVWFSNDGRAWSEPQAVGDPDYWLWRITWHEGRAYGFAYGTTGDRSERTLRLYRSDDGVKFAPAPGDVGVRYFPNEHAMSFRRDGAAVVLLRRDPPGGGAESAKQATALAGTAKPPYTDWTWRDLGVRVGGPQVLALPGGRYVAAVRLYEPQPHTALAWFDPERGTLNEFLALPSGGDTSYAGLVWHGGMLWVSYYSSHEGKTAIYLARVRL